MRIWKRPGGQRMAMPRPIGLLSSLVSCLVLSRAATLRLPIPSIDLVNRILDGQDDYYTTKSIHSRTGSAPLPAGKATSLVVAVPFYVKFPSTSQDPLQ